MPAMTMTNKVTATVTRTMATIPAGTERTAKMKTAMTVAMGALPLMVLARLARLMAPLTVLALRLGLKGTVASDLGTTAALRQVCPLSRCSP